MNIVKQSLWESLSQSGKPIILYGMGNGADKILDFCDAKNIKINDMFTSGEFVREHSFRGFKVKSLTQINELYNDFCILLAFGTRIDSVIDKIYAVADKHELYVPNFPVFGENIYFDYNYYLQNQTEIQQVYNLLADEQSREVYECAINFNITGKLKYLEKTESTRQDALDLLDLHEDLSYIDLGAYDGDTIFELLYYHKNIKKIYAFEPDMKNYTKLEKNISENRLDSICNLYNLGAWSKEERLYFNAQGSRGSNFCSDYKKYKYENKMRVDSLDNIFAQQFFSNEVLIKYDVEGAELEALEGSRDIIKKYSPKLIVSLYHKTGDIFKIPLYINSLNPNYKFYLRKHKYIPCWDLNLYATTENQPTSDKISTNRL